MSALTSAESRALLRLVNANPFDPARLELESEILGEDFVAEPPVWSADPEDFSERPNVENVNRRIEAWVEAAAGQLGGASPAELEDYELLAQYALLYRFEDRMFQWLTAAPTTESHKVPFYADFAQQHEHLLRPAWAAGLPSAEPAHQFALLFQVRRAFHYIYRRILGGSRAAARLRADVWDSVFTQDMRRYRRALWSRMQDIPTLIQGPTGTGKELVAEALGRSRYLSFDARRLVFEDDVHDIFVPVHLAALSPMLVEAELFGHERGAFTGADTARAGYFDSDRESLTVFLDEIAEISPELQVKLLRVLQSRTFSRLGETGERRYAGKIVAATHQNLAERMNAGQFRSDFYYRLCADRLSTPSLVEQLDGQRDELHRLCLALAGRLLSGRDRNELAEQCVDFICEELGLDYAWPGNMRELEQCIRSVLLRGRYQPMGPIVSGSPLEAELNKMKAGSLSAEELLSVYCTLVYVQIGSYEGAARRLKLDRRTVRRKVDAELAKRLSHKPSAEQES